MHVSERLLRLHDGPLLEQSLKAGAGALIGPPEGKQFRPVANIKNITDTGAHCCSPCRQPTGP
jgi:hypothetical protein